MIDIKVRFGPKVSGVLVQFGLIFLDVLAWLGPIFSGVFIFTVLAPVCSNIFLDIKVRFGSKLSGVLAQFGLIFFSN